MTVTLNSAGGSSVPNWTLVTSSAPTGVSTVTYSGLSGYSKYRILAVGLAAVSGTSAIRINGDSGANYSDIFAGPAAFSSSSPTTPLTITLNQTSLALSSAAGTIPTFDIEIDNATILTPKSIKGWGTDANLGASTATGGYGQISGIYATSSLLTSISIVRSANFTSGTIYLLGAN